MSVAQQQSDWPLAEIKQRLGRDLGDVVFFSLLHIITLPFATKSFSGFSKEGLKHMFKAYSDFVAMLLDENCTDGLEELLRAANRAHASLDIPPDQVLASLAAFAVATHDWLANNTTIEVAHREEQAFLNALSHVGAIMNVGDTPKSIEEYRQLFLSSCNTGYCPLAKKLMLRTTSSFKEMRGWRRLLLAQILYPSSLSSNLRVVFGVPQLPGPFYTLIQKTICLRWVAYDLIFANGLSK